MELYKSTMAISCQNAQNFFFKKGLKAAYFLGKFHFSAPIVLTTVPRLQRLSSDIVSSVDVLIQIHDFQICLSKTVGRSALKNLDL